MTPIFFAELKAAECGREAYGKHHDARYPSVALNLPNAEFCLAVEAFGRQ